MSFRKFTEYGAASRKKITIRTNDLLFISKMALNQFKENAHFAYFHIDEINYLIGVEFLSEKPSDGAFRKISEERAGVSINIGPVLRFFGVKRVANKYLTEYENKEGMLVFSIKGLLDRDKNPLDRRVIKKNFL
jgi:hypothetical protein